MREMLIQSSFNAGVFSALMQAQVYHPKRPNALAVCENMIVTKQGPLVRRGGTAFVFTKNLEYNRIISIDPYVGKYKNIKIYDATSGSHLWALVEGISRRTTFFRGDPAGDYVNPIYPIFSGQANITNITKDLQAVVTYTGADIFSAGDVVQIQNVTGMLEINLGYYYVQSVDTAANTVNLRVNSTNLSTYVSGGTMERVYTVQSPYVAYGIGPDPTLESLDQLEYAQSGDTIFCTHPSFTPYALVRTGSSSWVWNQLELIDGPYQDINTTTTTLTASGATGSVTITASSIVGINDGVGFDSKDVGRLIRFKSGGNAWGWMQITAFTSTTQVTALVKSTLTSGSATTLWRLGAWGRVPGFPRHITFYQNRICFANIRTDRDRYDMSETGGYSSTTLNMAPTALDASGTVTATNAIYGNIPATVVSDIQWISPDYNGLLVGTVGPECLIRGTTADQVITPNNTVTSVLSSTNSAAISPVQAGISTIFIRNNLESIYEMSYSFQADRMRPVDVSALAQELLQPNSITGLAYQYDLYETLWVSVGPHLVGSAFYREEEVVGFFKLLVAKGITNPGEFRVLALDSLRTRDVQLGGTIKQFLWLMVNRDVVGDSSVALESYNAQIEYMTDGDLQGIPCYLDSSVVRTISSSKIYGLQHLEGETVQIMLDDGRIHPERTVQNFYITLDPTIVGVVNRALVGLKTSWKVQTLPMANSSMPGGNLGTVKQITNIRLKVLNSLGLKYGPDADHLNEYSFGRSMLYYSSGNVPQMYTGDTELLPLPSGADTYGQVYLTHDGPFPFTLLAIMGTAITHQD